MFNRKKEKEKVWEWRQSRHTADSLRNNLIEKQIHSQNPHSRVKHMKDIFSKIKNTCSSKLIELKHFNNQTSKGGKIRVVRKEETLTDYLFTP